MDHPREVAPAVGLELADRKMHRKNAAILTAAADFAPNADDFLDARGDVIADITVVFAPVGLRHQDFNVFTDQFGGAIAKKALRRRVDVLNKPSIANGNYGRDRRLQDAA
jgi:hypothetical protein